METKIYSLVRVAVAGVAVVAGAAVLNVATAQPSTDQKSVATLNEGPAPAPTCDPGNPNCKMPTMNPW